MKNKKIKFAIAMSVCVVSAMTGVQTPIIKAQAAQVSSASSQESKGQAIHKGKSSFFNGGYTGGCAMLDPIDQTYYLAALNASDYNNAELAGAYLEVTGNKGTTHVLVSDVLYSGQKGDLNITEAAYRKITDSNAQNADVTWKVVALPTNEPISYKFKEGSSKYWCGIQIRNHRYPVSKVELVKNDGTTQELKRENYNYFIGSNLGDGPYTFKVTDIYGNVCEDEINNISDKEIVKGKSNFGSESASGETSPSQNDSTKKEDKPNNEEKPNTENKTNTEENSNKEDNTNKCEKPAIDDNSSKKEDSNKEDQSNADENTNKQEKPSEQDKTSKQEKPSKEEDKPSESGNQAATGFAKEYAQDAIHTGDATFYGGGYSGGCASLDPVSKDYDVAALNIFDYNNALMAGAYLEVTGENGKVNVLITDLLPEGQKGDIDLNEKTFEKIIPKEKGRVKATWRVIALPTTEPISYKFKEGSSQYWCGVQVRNHRYPVAKLEYKNAKGEFIELHREQYNYFISSEMGPGPYTFRVTDIYGHVMIDENIPLNLNNEVKGKGNFEYLAN